MEILGKYRALPQPSLQGLEHGRHVVQLLPGELVRVAVRQKIFLPMLIKQRLLSDILCHVFVHLHRGGQGDVVEDESLVLGLEIVSHGVASESLRLEV